MDKVYTLDNKKGYTLVELLAVIMVLALLLTIAVPAVLNVTPNAKRRLFIAQVQRDLSKLQADSLFDEDTYYNSELDLCLINRVNPILLTQLGFKNEYDGFIIQDIKN